MKYVSEAAFTKKVSTYLKGINKCWFFKVWGGGMQKRGIPDIIGIINGRFFALELKATDGSLSALQTRNINLIKQCGGYAAVVWPKDWERVQGDLCQLLKSS